MYKLMHKKFRPPGREPEQRKNLRIMVPMSRFELLTYALRMRRSTN